MSALLSVPARRTPAPPSSAPVDLLAAADADRTALADRLHDGELQALVAARYACDAVARGASPVMAREAVQDALVTLRREVWHLRPRSEQGLSAALDDLSAQLVLAGQPGLRLSLDPGVAAALPAPAVAAAYRLVQAVARQAAAPHAVAPRSVTVPAVAAAPLPVRLGADGARALLTVDAAVDEPDHWSVTAQALGGDLVVAGTRTLLLLPLAADDDKDHP